MLFCQAVCLLALSKPMHVPPLAPQVQFGMHSVCAMGWQGRVSEALALLQAALTAAPDYAEAHNNLGAWCGFL